MKYEMIFGDEKLFDGAPDDAEYAGWFCQETRWYMILNGKILFSDGGTWCTSDNPYLSADIAAMRRTIKEPKQWTWEDAKAGRLPDVGCDIQYIESQKRVSVVAINDNEIVLLAKSNGSKFFVLDTDLLLKYYNPIETPAEKAQREEDEFVVAMLDAASQEQLMSAGFKSGVIAAYRKLKGGE